MIAVEGRKTEPEYFAVFNSPKITAHVRCIKGDSNSSPPQVLTRMKQHLKTQDIRATDEAWLVVDKDQWTDTQLAELHAWSKTRENYGFALSNPKFEYWLLLHFEDGAGIGSSRDCDERLKKHLPNYRKGIRSSQFTEERIRTAIRHAKAREIHGASIGRVGTTTVRCIDS